jgi:hypothetical protein
MGFAMLADAGSDPAGGFSAPDVRMIAICGHVALTAASWRPFLSRQAFAHR